MSGATCATCRFFGADRCRRSPPVWISAGDHVQPGFWQPFVRPDDRCGEHAPTPAVGVPGLPDGWEWREVEHGTRAVYAANPAFYAHVSPSGMTSTSSAPTGVVLAVVARHRARAGGAA